MTSFLSSAVGALFGAIFGFLSATLVARRTERRATTYQLVSEFFSDTFLANRIAIWELWCKLQAGEVTAEQIAPGFWYPGRPDYYTGEHDGTFTMHQRLELYLGYITRLAYAVRLRRLDRRAAQAALGMNLLWHDSLIQQVAEAAARQAQEANVPVPDWTLSAQLVQRQLLVQSS